jgi:hypothetical protein
MAVSVFAAKIPMRKYYVGRSLKRLYGPLHVFCLSALVEEDKSCYKGVRVFLLQHTIFILISKRATMRVDLFFPLSSSKTRTASINVLGLSSTFIKIQSLLHYGRVALSSKLSDGPSYGCLLSSLSNLWKPGYMRE